MRVRAISPKKHELALLRAQYSAPNRTVSSPQLESLAGVSGGYSVVNGIYGRFAHRLCNWLNIDPDDGSGSEKDRWWSIWSVGYRTNNGFLWEMHREVSEALEFLGWVEPKEQSLPEELDESISLPEGATRRISVNVYERNPQARQQCIAYYGHACCICGFDFATCYGTCAEGYIHVHHLKAISEIGKEYQVDPVKDMRPLCPNCHSVVHMRTPSYSIEEVKKMIRLMANCG